MPEESKAAVYNPVTHNIHTDNVTTLTPLGNEEPVAFKINPTVPVITMPDLSPGQYYPMSARFWVKSDSGEPVELKAADTADPRVVGTYIGKKTGAAAITEYAPIKAKAELQWSSEDLESYNDKAEEYQTMLEGHNHSWETTAGDLWSATAGGTVSPWHHVTATYTPQGPVRTATYLDSGTASAGTFVNDFTWYVDNNLSDTTAAVWDPNVRMMFGDHSYDGPSQEEVDKANKKSMELLKKWLSPEEYNYLIEQGNLELPSQYEKGTIYIINKDPTKRIGIKKDGKVVEKSLCIHTDYGYAVGDQLLANIMLLKNDEKKFLSTANVHDYYA